MINWKPAHKAGQQRDKAKRTPCCFRTCKHHRDQYDCGLIVVALLTDWFSWQAQSLDPELTAQGAFSHAMLALQGQLVAVVILMGGYLAARTARGLVTRPRNTTFDVVTLFLLYSCAQGAATALLLRLFR